MPWLRMPGSSVRQAWSQRSAGIKHNEFEVRSPCAEEGDTNRHSRGYGDLEVFYFIIYGSRSENPFMGGTQLILISETRGFFLGSSLLSYRKKPTSRTADREMILTRQSVYDFISISTFIARQNLFRNKSIFKNFGDRAFDDDPFRWEGSNSGCKKNLVAPVASKNKLALWPYATLCQNRTHELNEQNGGQTSSWNLGLRKTQGQHMITAFQMQDVTSKKQYRSEGRLFKSSSLHKKKAERPLLKHF